jgi:hypothetical protein
VALGGFHNFVSVQINLKDLNMKAKEMPKLLPKSVKDPISDLINCNRLGQNPLAREILAGLRKIEQVLVFWVTFLFE